MLCCPVGTLRYIARSSRPQHASCCQGVEAETLAQSVILRMGQHEAGRSKRGGGEGTVRFEALKIRSLESLKQL
jgi:hypothetical protein